MPSLSTFYLISSYDTNLRFNMIFLKLWNKIVSYPKYKTVEPGWIDFIFDNYSCINDLNISY